MIKSFSEERKIKILEEIEQREKALVIDLVKKFNVSDTTIRRDLDKLAQDNLIVRVHGGALAFSKFSKNIEFKIEDRKIINLSEKRRIARKAKEFINDGDNIILGSGTTVLELAKILNNFNKLKVLTYSLETALELSKNNNIELIIIGGKLNRSSSILTGIETINYLEKINVDKLFFSISGIDTNKGLSSPLSIDAEIVSKMIDCSRLNYLLVDSTKFEKLFFKQVKSVNVVDTLITDNKIDSETVNSLEELGIDVIIV
jgi:DeoR family transcriptional regulator, fructose operon transcriptional repressor